MISAEKNGSGESCEAFALVELTKGRMFAKKSSKSCSPVVKFSSVVRPSPVVVVVVVVVLRLSACCPARYARI